MKKFVQEKVRGKKTKHFVVSMLFLLLILFIMLFGKEVQATEKFDDFYEIQNEIVTRILPETTVKDLKNNLENPNVVVKDKDGNVVSDDVLVGTGMKLTIDTIESVDTYTLSVIGDVDGNGKISITDLTKMKLNSVNLIKLENEYKLSADIDNNGRVTLTDLAQLNLALVNIKDIIAPKSFLPIVTHTDDTITISGTTTDNSGEQIEYFFRIDDNDWVQNTDKTNGSYTFTDVDMNYVHFVLMKVKDKSGNEKKTEFTIIGEPNVIVNIVPSTTEWTNQDIQATFDVQSNVLNTQSYISKHGQTKYNKHINTTTIEKNGIVKAVIWKKQFGILAQDEKNITNIDKLNPNNFNISATADLNTITINARTDDANATNEYGKSEIKEYEYVITNEDVELREITTENSYTFNDLTVDGEYSVEVIAKDNAGNIITSEGKVNSDFTFTLIYEYNDATEENNDDSKSITYNNLYGELANPIKKYTIVYETNGGTEVTNETIEYMFEGWFKEETFENIVTRDTLVRTPRNHSIFARWEDKTIRLPVTTKNGYIFDGWYEKSDFDENGFEAGQLYRPTDNVTLYAKWNVIEYTLTYNLVLEDISVKNPESYIVEDQITLNNPIKAGYTFIGWTEEGEITPEEEKTITRGTTGVKEFTAHWEAVPYTISYELNGGEAVNPDTYTIESEDITLNNPIRTGYTFKGWTGSNGTRPNTNITITSGSIGNKEYEANWEKENYTITYNLDGGSVETENPISYDVETNSFTLNNPVKAGYTFTGWTGTNGETPEIQITIAQGSTENRTYIANWTINQYTITLNANGGSIIPETITEDYGTEITLLASTREGYSFMGWYDNEELEGEGIAPESKITLIQDITYYAKWDANNYVITYEYNGGNKDNEITSKTIEFGKEYGELEQPSQEYKATFIYNDGRANTEQTATYIFDGWYLSEDYNEETKVTENIVVATASNHTLYAKWIVQDKVTIPIVGTRLGYDFMGWYEDSEFSGTAYTEGTEISLTKDLTMYAYWKGQNFDIDYNYNGATSGNTEGGKTVTVGNPYGELPSPGKEFTITYDLKNGTDQTGTSTYTPDNWYKEATFTNAVNSTTQVAPEDIQGEHIIHFKWTGGNISLLNPTRYGYTFVGWYETSNLTGTMYAAGESYSPTKDITLYAKWSQDTSTLTIDTNGGTYTGAVSQEQYVGSTIKIADPIRTGYTFNGWDVTSGNGTTSGQNFTFGTQNTTLTANWTINTYTIEYTLDGGIVYGTNPTSYKVTTASITLINPTRDGYTFSGWTGSNGTIPSTDVTIPTGSTGNKTYTANWTENKSSITIVPAGGSVSVTSSVSGIEAISSNKTYTQSYNTTLTIGTPTKASETETTNYTITYNANGGTAAKSTDTAKKTVDRTYTFGGWTKSSPFYGTLTPQSTNTKYTFPSTEGVSSTITATYSSSTSNNTTSVTLPTATKNYTVTLNYNYTGSTNESLTATSTLNGWFTASSGGENKGKGGVSYTPTINETLSLSETLYAQWTNGSVTLPAPTRDGYTFDGWFTSSTSGTKVTGPYTPTKDVTLYAHWKAPAIYAKLYDTDNDGVGDKLEFASTESKLSINNVIEDYGNIAENLIAGKYNKPWYNSTKNITTANFVDIIYPLSTKYLFYQCEKLVNINNINYLNTSKVTDMSFMFAECKRLTRLDVSDFDTSKVTDMSFMFCNCYDATNINTSNLNTSKVTDMRYMFKYCTSIKSMDLQNFDTSNVTDMTGMFMNCFGLQSINLSSFKTNNVTNMEDMFMCCSELQSIDLSNFNTGNVTNMSGMFSFCTALTSVNVSSFNTSKVTSMSDMFLECEKLITLDLSNFDTSNVTNIYWMFMDCYNLTSLNLGDFKTSKVTNMESLFSDCKSLTSLDLSSFDTSNVTDMSFMFDGCKRLTRLDVSNFNTSKVTKMKSMFQGCGSLTILDLRSFDTRNTVNMKQMFGMCYNLSEVKATKGKWVTSQADTLDMFPSQINDVKYYN